MAELARSPSLPEPSNNISDVLASIRRLIAQDEANRQPEPAPLSASSSDVPDQPVAAEIEAYMKTAEESDLLALQRQIAPPLILRKPEVHIDDIVIARPAANLARPVEDIAPQPEQVVAPQQIRLLGASTQVEGLLPEPGLATEALPDATLPKIPKTPEPPSAVESILTEPSMPVEASPAPVGMSPSLEDAIPHLFATDDDEPATEKLIRAVVRETVLQELQGELGGRVSRKIRDLVRAEINSALNAQQQPI